MNRSCHWFGSTAAYGYDITISFGSLPMLTSKVKGFTGECAPVRIWKAFNERFATGFFKKVKRIKILGIEFKIRIGEVFHGLITEKGIVLSTYGINDGHVMFGYENDPEVQDPSKMK